MVVQYLSNRKSEAYLFMNLTNCRFEVVEHYDFEYNGLAIVDYKQVNLDLMQGMHQFYIAKLFKIILDILYY